MNVVCILDSGTYKAGDPPPNGYVQWHAWAETQFKAGLRQKECGRCGLWKFPQELSDLTDRHKMQSSKGPVVIESPVCLRCVSRSVSLLGAEGVR